MNKKEFDWAKILEIVVARGDGEHLTKLDFEDRVDQICEDLTSIMNIDVHNGNFTDEEVQTLIAEVRSLLPN